MTELAALNFRTKSVSHAVDRFVLAQSKSNLILVTLLVQGLLLYGDFVTGPYVPFGVFYLLSLYFSIKYFGVRVAYLLAFLLVCGKTYIKFTHAAGDMLTWQILWQFCSSLSIYTVFCYLMSSQLSARKRAEDIAMLALLRAGQAEQKLLNISEEVQQRIGRELHDDLGQQLTGIAFVAHVLGKKLEVAGLEERGDVDRIATLLNQAIGKTRYLAQGLCPEEMHEQTVSDMIVKFAKHAEAIYHLDCEVLLAGTFKVKDQNAVIHLLRIAQEAVNNAVKHGKATHIVFRVSSSLYEQKLEILDNGCGIDDLKLHQKSEGLGMRSMRYRSDIIGATFDIAIRRGGGSQIVISMPLSQPEEATVYAV